MSGASVELEDGRVVQPSECWDTPPQPGRSIVVASCPTESHIDNFVAHSSWNQYFEDESISAIIHLCPPDVLKDPKYLEWTTKFVQPTVAHYACLGEGSLNAYPSSDHLIEALTKIAPKYFQTLPEYSQGPKVPEPYQLLAPLSKVVLLPERKKGLSSPPSNPAFDFKLLPEHISETPEEYADPSLFSPEHYPVLDVFGTGAADPARTRTVSGMLLRVSPSHSILMDPGAGTLSQMARKYGSQLDEIISSVEVVWISHKHADHHLGLMTLLHRIYQQKINKARDSCSILIFGPLIFAGTLLEHLLALKVHNEGAFDYKFHLNSELYEEDAWKQFPVFEQMGFAKVLNAPAIHGGGGAVSILFRHKDDWSLIISGDSRPCLKLVELGPCTALVHEATFVDHDLDFALARAHATTQEAIAVAQRAKAEFLILTHFSQRQEVVPLTDFAEDKHKYLHLHTVKYKNSNGNVKAEKQKEKNTNNKATAGKQKERMKNEEKVESVSSSEDFADESDAQEDPLNINPKLKRKLESEDEYKEAINEGKEYDRARVYASFDLQSFYLKRMTADPSLNLRLAQYIDVLEKLK